MSRRARRYRRRRNPIVETFGAADFITRRPVLALAIGGALLWALAPKQSQQVVSNVAPGVTLPTAPGWVQQGAQQVSNLSGGLIS